MLLWRNSADAPDSKSGFLQEVWVQVPPGARSTVTSTEEPAGFKNLEALKQLYKDGTCGMQQAGGTSNRRSDLHETASSSGTA